MYRIHKQNNMATICWVWLDIFQSPLKKGQSPQEVAEQPIQSLQIHHHLLSHQNINLPLRGTKVKVELYLPLLDPLQQHQMAGRKMQNLLKDLPKTKALERIRLVINTWIIRYSVQYSVSSQQIAVQVNFFLPYLLRQTDADT